MKKKVTSHDKPLGFYTELQSKLNYHVSSYLKKREVGRRRENCSYSMNEGLAGFVKLRKC